MLEIAKPGYFLASVDLFWGKAPAGNASRFSELHRNLKLILQSSSLLLSSTRSEGSP